MLVTLSREYLGALGTARKANSPPPYSMNPRSAEHRRAVDDKLKNLLGLGKAK